MKKLAKLFALLVAVLGLVTLVSCELPGVGTGTQDPEPLKPYNALGNFVDGGDELYVFTANTEDELGFTYDKADEAKAWSYMYKEINESLKGYKKLTFNAYGTGTMLIRLEAADGTTKEVRINVQSGAFTYDWNLMNDGAFLESIVKIVIIAAPGKAEGVGEIHMSKLTFDEGIAGATGNYIIQTDYNDIPSNVNEYNGKDVEFDVNAKWEDSGDEAYEIEQDPETKEVSVKYNKGAGMEWAYMVSNVKGNFAKFKYVVFVAKAAAGTKVLLKAEGAGVAKEVNCEFDGTEQTFVLDISTLSNEAKSAISKIILFGTPGGEGKGKFTIYEAYMTETSPIEVEETIVNVYDGVSEKFDISNNWYDGGDGHYTVSKVADGVKVDYDKKSE